MKILLVEDDGRVAEAMIATLQEAGHEITWARSALEARRLFAWHFDAYVFDVDLGRGETGLDLARHLLRDVNPLARVVIWSGTNHGDEASTLGAWFVLKGMGAPERVLAALREVGK